MQPVLRCGRVLYLSGALLLLVTGCPPPGGGGGGGGGGGTPPPAKFAGPTHSSTLAITTDDRRLVVVNREANSVSVIEVRDANGGDVANKLAELEVEQEPR